MRGIAARLLPLLAVSCCAPSPSSSAAPPLLLVLRAGCRTLDPAVYSTMQLRAHAAALGREPLFGSAVLLNYNDTCGAVWRDSIWRAVRDTLNAGGAVAAVGWPGARTCLLLSAAGHAPPDACVMHVARAAILPMLAERLRWHYVQIPVTKGHEDACVAALQTASAALSAAGGVSVSRAPLQSIASAANSSKVVIGCGADASLREVTITRSTTLELQPFDFNFAGLETPGNESTSPALQLLLTDKTREIFVTSSTAVYEQLLSAAEAVLRADHAGYVKVNASYILYERDETEATWRLVTEFATSASRTFIDDDEWTVAVQAIDAVGWRTWRALYTVSGHGASADTMTSDGPVVLACAAVLAVLTLCALGVGTRYAARVRRGRRRRGDVVLAVVDFAFPLDEPRRLPDGMETMLSCWLQQLHEFGGPELERPDLLKQPAPPSAPSSTASGSRLALDRRTRYKGDPVHLKTLSMCGGTGVGGAAAAAAASALELRRKATDVLLVMHALRHENLNPFIGCLCESRPALVFDYCGRGSLEDVLMADDIKLDWTFRLSLLTDLVKGLRYLHSSSLRVHGRLSSRNCVVDSRWVLRLTDYGLPDFYRTQGLTPPRRNARELLWTAPELLRAGVGADAGAGAGAGEGARGTQPGDVFSFAIIMQEVIVRGEPYCMLALSPEDLVDKLCRPPPLIRPSVSMGAAPPEAVSIMRQCWAEQPEMRPTTDALIDIFRLLHRGRKINIVDSMFEMLEKYSNNLEELIKERTEQLDMEKKKTEQLLNRMLPKSVAERLVLGLRVEPEEFEEVSIYFSDIVGFTALAARSTPVQVVALLNDLYTAFDATIQQYRVYKVETIGDAYMVVGGLPVRARDHAESIATMALHLLHLAGCFRIRHLPHTPLHLRIGLHSGACCAGVVGLTMPRYCLFGDTVNTASRMESTGAAWRIQMSAATAARLEQAGGYRLRSRGLTQIKGKGVMHTYWLLGKDGFDKPLPTPPPLPANGALLEHEAEYEMEPSCGEMDCEPPPPPAQPQDRSAWQRSGAMSADSSPPATAPYERYRCRAGTRALRRQWSLERGDAMAAARALSPATSRRAAGGNGGLTATTTTTTTTASAISSCISGRAASRYRTRPDTDAAATSASFD